jgi:hypothetical protein
MSRFRLSYIVKVLLDFRLLFRGAAQPDCLYKRQPCSPKVGSEEREVGNSAEPYSEQSLCPRRRATTVLLVEAHLSPLRSSSYHSTVLLVLVDSSLAFALKASYILLVVYS